MPGPAAPFSVFGMPPEDAVLDADAALAAMAYEPQMDLPFLEDNSDVPRAPDANPFKDPSGMQKLSDGHLNAMGSPNAMPDGNMMPGSMDNMGGMDSMPMNDEPLDEEALAQSILDGQEQDNAASGAYQEGVLETNEEDEQIAMKNRMGGV